jgi:hypothetical protein
VDTLRLRVHSLAEEVTDLGHSFVAGRDVELGRDCGNEKTAPAGVDQPFLDIVQDGAAPRVVFGAIV